MGNGSRARRPAPRTMAQLHPSLVHMSRRRLCKSSAVRPGKRAYLPQSHRKLSPPLAPPPYCPDRWPTERARMITGIVRGWRAASATGLLPEEPRPGRPFAPPDRPPLRGGCGTVRLSASGREEPAATEGPCGPRAEGLLKTPRGMPEANRMTLNRRGVRLRRPVACSIPSARPGAKAAVAWARGSSGRGACARPGIAAWR